MSDNINHMLSKAKITRHMVKSYNINYLLDIVNKNVNIPSENSLLLFIHFSTTRTFIIKICIFLMLIFKTRLEIWN